MKSLDGNYFNIGRRLTLTLGLLVALILGGNGLVILQFERARLQTDRLTGVSQQLIAVLRLQEGLLSFHQRLNELAQSKDARRLVTEAKPLRTALLEQTRQTRNTLAYLPSEFRVDPAFLTALDTMEITLPSQLQDITALATAGDWEAVRLRLDNELKRMETTTGAHVKSLDRDLDEELPRAVANMRNVQRRIFLIVPATAISTVLIAAFFGWAIARRILELRLEERVSERTRIARDLHDTLLQSLAGVSLQLDGISKQAAPETASLIGRVREHVDSAFREARVKVWNLRSTSLEVQGLEGALRQLVERIRPATTAPCYVVVSGQPRSCAPEIEEELLRIAQEAINNANQHAQAREIRIALEYRGSSLTLSISDDGCGFDFEEGSGKSGHWGLKNMQERAAQIRGTCKITTAVGQGTRIEIRVPLSSWSLRKPLAKHAHSSFGGR